MSSLPPLPEGWTEHKAPSGQKYYWHKASKTSTYKRPSAPGSAPARGPAPAPASTSTEPRWETALSYQWVPGTDWLRVTTNRHHRFFFHPDTRESVWDPPDEVANQMGAGGKRKAPREEGSSKRVRLEPAPASPQDAPHGFAQETLARDQPQDVPQDDLPDQPREDPHGQPSGGEQQEEEEEEEEEEQSDDDDEWQLQMAAEMAAEAEAAEEAERAAAAEATSPGEGEATTSAEAPAEAAAESQKVGEEEALQAFFSMLTSLNGTGKEVNPMAPWELERPKFENTEAYALVPEGEREDAFNEWCKMRLKEKRAARQAKAAPRPHRPPSRQDEPRGEVKGEGEEYLSLLREKVTSTRARWEDFVRDHSSDPRFRPDEKRFKAHLRELGETKRLAAQRAEEEFLQLLEKINDKKEQVLPTLTGERKEDEKIVSAAWPKAKVGLDKDPRYDAVGSSTRRAQLWAEFVLGPVPAPAPRARQEKREERQGSASHPDPDERRKKQEAALAQRAEEVARRKAGVASSVRRAATQAEHETNRVLYEQRLVDKVHDAYLPFSPAASRDLWGGYVPLPLGEQEALFAAHKERLLARKGKQLDALFAKAAPSLDVSVDEVVPHVREEKDFARFGLDKYVCHVFGGSLDEALERYFAQWDDARTQRAIDAFHAMLRENAFLEFWGRLQKTKKELPPPPQDPGAEKEGDDPLGQQEDEEMEQDLLGMKFDLDEVRAVLKDDARYRAFAHRPDERDAWIERYLSELRASKRAVRQRE